MEPSTIISLSALIVALFGAVTGFVFARKSAGENYVRSLELRVNDLRKDYEAQALLVQQCTNDRAALKEENYRLMERIVRLENNREIKIEQAENK